MDVPDAAWIRLDAGARPPRGGEPLLPRASWERIAIGPAGRDALTAALAEAFAPGFDGAAGPAAAAGPTARRRRPEPAIRAASRQMPAARAAGHDRRHLGRRGGRRAPPA